MGAALTLQAGADCRVRVGTAARAPYDSRIDSETSSSGMAAGSHCIQSLINHPLKFGLAAQGLAHDQAKREDILRVLADCARTQLSTGRGVELLRGYPVEIQSGTAEYLLSSGDDFPRRLLGRSVRFFLAEHLLSRALDQNDKELVKRARRHVSPPFVSSDAFYLALGADVPDPDVANQRVAARMMRMCELLDRVRVDTTYEGPDLKSLFAAHRRKKVAFPSPREIEACSLRLMRGSPTRIVRIFTGRATQCQSLVYGSKYAYGWSFKFPTCSVSPANPLFQTAVEASLSSDTPFALALYVGPMPLWICSFFPEDGRTCSIVQNQGFPWYRTQDGKELHRSQIPILRHIRCETLMLEASRQLLLELGFEHIRVPAADYRTIHRFAGREISPDRVRPLYDDAARATNMQERNGAFFSARSRRFNRQIGHLKSQLNWKIPGGEAV